MEVSKNGLDLIKSFEGCRLQAYQDPIGIWTIGYGHTANVKRGQVITQFQADNYLKEDCAFAENAVRSYDKIYHWNQNQFDALVSFTFNCGAGSLNQLTNNGKRTVNQISLKISAYCNAGGKPLAGLVRRREAERVLFLKPITATDSSLSATPLWVGLVTASKLNVRTGAGTTYGNLPAYPHLLRGDGVDVCDTARDSNGAGWYYVRIWNGTNHVYGFVSAQYIKKM